MTIQFMSVVPILRIFDLAKGDKFYRGFLGFKVDWDHRFDDHAPLYRQVSRGEPGPAPERASWRRQSRRAATRDDARRGRIPSRNQRQKLSLHEAWA
jgi:hypothetical protein